MAKSALLVVVMVALVSYTAAQTSGGSGIPPCAAKLTACYNDLNTTTPPPTSCCGPIKEVVTTEKTCLCNIYNNPAFIQAFQINVTQALNLITRCHVDTVKDPSTFCKGVAAQSPSSSSSPSAGSTPTPPGSASRSSSPGNAAAKVTGVGSAGIVSILLMLGAYTMLN